MHRALLFRRSRCDLLGRRELVLQQGHHCHQDEEQHCLRLADALESGAGVERVGDVECKTFRHARRRAVGQCEVLVEELETVGHGEERAHGDARHHQRDDDLEHGLRAACAVHGSRFEHVGGQRLHAGDVDDHHVADLLPTDQDDQAPEAVLLVIGERTLPVGEHAVEQQHPDVAQDDATDEVRHEEHGAEQVGSANRLGQQIRDGECDHIDDDRGHDCQQRRKQQRVQERLVLQRLLIVPETHKLCISNGAELAEAQVDAVDERHHETDDECSECRKYK